MTAQQNERERIARVLTEVLPTCSTMAMVLECLVSCEDNDGLTDAEAKSGQSFFESLAAENPQAAELASGGTTEIRETILRYLDGKDDAPNELDLHCFVDMIETGEANLGDFMAVGGCDLTGAVQKAQRAMLVS